MEPSTFPVAVVQTLSKQHSYDQPLLTHAALGNTTTPQQRQTIIQQLITQLGTHIFKQLQSTAILSPSYTLTPTSTTWLTYLWLLKEVSIHQQLLTPVPQEQHELQLTPELKQLITSHTLHQFTLLQHQPPFHTLYAQYLYESLRYEAQHVQQLRQYTYHRTIQGQLQAIPNYLATPSVDIHQSECLLTLYRLIFQLMQTHQQELFRSIELTVPKTGKKTSKVQNDHLIDRQIAAALESTFPQSQVTTFVQLSQDTQKHHLQVLMSVVVGIRLYNMFIGKGGTGIEALHTDKFMSTVEQQRSAVSTQAKHYQTLQIQLQWLLEQSSAAGSTITMNTDLQYMQHLHTYYHQFLAIYNQVLLTITDGQQQIQQLQQRYNTELQQLHTLIDKKSSVAKEVVYPLFTSLCNLYSDLHQQYLQLKDRQTLVEQLGIWAQKLELQVDDSDTQQMQKFTGSKTEAATEVDEKGIEKFITTPAGALTPESSAPQLMPQRYTQQNCSAFLSLPLMYNGYCPVALVRDNALKHGNARLGLVCIANKFYTVSSVQAMQLFAADPEYYIEQMVKHCTTYAELIYLLNLSETIPYTDLYEYCIVTSNLQHDTDVKVTDENLQPSASSSLVVPVTNKCDAGTQSETHINTDATLLSDKTNQHEWNEWQLRREALHLATITTMRTHSTQTHDSHFKRDSDTQYTLQPHQADGTAPGKSTMTGITKGQQTERTTQYMAGLRGNRSVKDVDLVMSKVTLDDIVEDASNPQLNKPIR